MFQCDLIPGDQIFSEISASEWNGLARTGFTNTPFQQFAYQKAWWTHLGPGELHTYVMRHPDGRLAALGCFYLLDGVLYFNGSKEESDYLDLICAPEDAKAAWTTILDCLSHSQKLQCQAVSLSCVPADSPTRSLLPQLASSRGFVFSQQLDEVCPIIQLPDSFDTYLANIDKKQRHEIRRKMRRAVGADAEVELIDNPEELEQAVEDFLALLKESTPEKEAWLNPERSALFHEVAQAALADGMLQLMFISYNQKRTAALFNFSYNGRTWVYNSGIDISRGAHLSLGVVLTSYAIQTGIENGNTTFDFLRGDENYKYRFGAEDARIFHLRLEKTG